MVLMRSFMLAQPRSKIATSSPCLLPKCFINCDSLVPASRAIATVLVFSYPFWAKRRFAALRMRSWDESSEFVFIDINLLPDGVACSS